MKVEHSPIIESGAVGLPGRSVVEAGLRRIGVVVVDNCALSRCGALLVLSRADDVELLACAKSMNKAVERCSATTPLVVLFNGGGGLSLTEFSSYFPASMRRPAILVYGGTEDRAQVEEAQSLGVRGYLGLVRHGDTLLSALRAVAAGGKCYSPAACAMAESRYQLRELSSREIEILRHLREGRSNKEIASDMGVCAETVKFHVANLMKKLDARDRTHAIVIALKRGVIQLHEDQLGEEP